MQERDGVRDRGPYSIPGVRDKGLQVQTAAIEVPEQKADADFVYFISSKEVVVDDILTVPANAFCKVKRIHLARVEEYARRLRAEYYAGPPGVKPEELRRK